ncbi:hypothetical protein ACI7BZ_12220 [Xanthobacter sp. AM11]|uniref:hypothetical protein n=1 Tax=Xanthobacter sp. AM11 TaxID=3380643 RepID=UPI0039BEE417
MKGSNIIDIASRREAIQSARWDAYAGALRRAQATFDIRDGIAAGEAWRDFLALFLPPQGELCKFRGRK